MTVLDGLYVVAILSALVGLIAVVRGVAGRTGWSAEVQRKIIHVATGLTALALPLVFSGPWPVIVLLSFAVLVMAVLRLPAIAVQGFGAALHGVDRQSYGEILLAIAVGITFVRAGSEPVLYVLPILILTVSDTAAALTGVRYGRRRFVVERGTKSLEGSAMFFVVTLVLAIATLLLMTDLPAGTVAVLSLVVAAFSTLVEADSWRGFDNLFVPVGLHLFLASYMHASLMELVVVMAALGVLIALCMWVGPRVGLTGHAARAYAILIFLILSVTAVHNAILPLAAVAAHIHARLSRPCRGAFPDLDLVAAMTLVALFWLAFGEWHGLSAINMYNLTFAALALGLLSTAGLAGWPHGGLAAVGLGGAVLLVSTVNPDAARWYGSLLPWVGVALGLSWFAPRWLGPAFDTARSLRLSGLALSTPLALYLSSLVIR
ncbi:MAG: hypothetical protein NW217_06085 [Hyphomicrobiaceae bacterium]|nr:hypothetical protein [Hyphomicrobiaceae bacterium]